MFIVAERTFGPQASVASVVSAETKTFHHRRHGGTQRTSKSPPSFAKSAKEGWGTRELLGQAEFGVELGLGIVAGPDVEGFRLYNPLLQGWAPELEFVGA
jgi:hypothetical protein